MFHRRLLIAAAVAFLSASPAASQSLAPAAPYINQAVELIDGGGEPKQLLQYRVAVGDVQKRKVVAKLSAGVSSGRGEDVVAGTETILGVESRVESIAANGDITHLMRYTSAELRTSEDSDAGTASADAVVDINEWVDSGVQVRIVLSPRGELREAEYVGNRPFQTIFVTAETMAQFTPVFPSQPVGPGARWKATEPLPPPTRGITRAATYTLKSTTPDEVVIEAEQTFALIPGTADPHVELAVKGGGTMVLRQPLSSVWPLHSENRWQSVTTTRFTSGSGGDFEESNEGDTRMSAW